MALLLLATSFLPTALAGTYSRRLVPQDYGVAMTAGLDPSLLAFVVIGLVIGTSVFVFGWSKPRRASRTAERPPEFDRAREARINDMNAIIARMPHVAERERAIAIRNAVRSGGGDTAAAYGEIQALAVAVSKRTQGIEDVSRVAPSQRRATETLLAQLESLLAREPRLSSAEEIRSLIEKASRGDSSAAAEADALLAAARDAIAEREQATAQVRGIAAKLAKLAQRLADGEIDGRAFEAARTAMESERAQLEDRIQAINSDLFIETFEKPI